MEITLSEFLWLAGGVAVTLILVIALVFWIRQESQTHRTRPDAAPPPTPIEEMTGPPDEPRSRPRGD